MTASDIFSRLTAVGVPILEQYTYGGTGDPNDVVNGRIADSQVNGSGTNDPHATASQSPATVMDFIFGKQVAQGGAVSYTYLPLIALAALVGIYFWTRGK